ATWERTHVVRLFNEAQRSVIRAEQQLAEIEPLGTGQWARAGDNIRSARAGLVQTESLLKGFASPLSGAAAAPAADANGIKNLWNSVDKAQKDVESAAGVMGIDFHLKGL